MKTDAEIVARMRQLENNRPNVFGNMLMIGLLQLTTFIGGVTMLLMAAYLLFYKEGGDMIEPVNSYKQYVNRLKEVNNITLAQLCLCLGILLLFIHILTKMINRRNIFLVEFIEILDPGNKQ